MYFKHYLVFYSLVHSSILWPTHYLLFYVFFSQVLSVLNGKTWVDEDIRVSDDAHLTGGLVFLGKTLNFHSASLHPGV